MTCLETLTPPPLPRDVSSSSRPSGLSCVRRSSWTQKLLRRSQTISVSRKTPRALRIPTASRDAESWIAGANAQPDEETFLIALADGTVIGGCGLRPARRAEPGDRLLARRSLLEEGLRHRSGARADRPRLRRPRAQGAAVLGAGHESELAPRAGEVRLPVDRRRSLPHPCARLIGAGRPLPARTRHLVRAQELGPDEARRVTQRSGWGGAPPRPGRSLMSVLESSGKVIRTARLVLRPLREGDDARIFALFANWNVQRFLSSPPSPYKAEHARDFVRRSCRRNRKLPRWRSRATTP